MTPQHTESLLQLMRKVTGLIGLYSADRKGAPARDLADAMADVQDAWIALNADQTSSSKLTALNDAANALQAAYEKATKKPF
ncbi:hypothetical protein [Dechloromonas sp.]|uniref:hypothetical protein n=1 Tax=Dechloromonas sp. TaxID=1917218 RepID=UPI00120FCF53|nr:hypothetical protein [Dechloromonas sp.]MBU3695421.1 hypothetical protein [Dechloromonas sp.]TEX48729.1 MAG: hypothetical protein CFR70_05430 [Rhodocyclaceae bacterium]